MKLTTLIVSICVIQLFSCKDNKVVDRAILERYSKALMNDDVKKFIVSECQQNCSLDSGKVVSNVLSDNVLKLKLGHWLNCSGAKHCNFSYDNKVLNLRLSNDPTDYNVREGDTFYLFSATACNCYFNLEIELNDFTEIPDSIFINGQYIENFMGAMRLE